MLLYRCPAGHEQPLFTAECRCGKQLQIVSVADPVPTRAATVHWVANGYLFHDAAEESEEFDDLDTCLRAAHAAGCRVVGVSVTKGRK